MTKQADATVSPADDSRRPFVRGQSCQCVVDSVEVVRAHGEFAKFQFALLIPRNEARNIFPLL